MNIRIQFHRNRKIGNKTRQFNKAIKESVVILKAKTVQQKFDSMMNKQDIDAVFKRLEVR